MTPGNGNRQPTYARTRRCAIAAGTALMKRMTDKRTADVVIVGGGVIGASIAFHLTEAGCRDVVVLDREREAAGGSTGRATGGARAQFATSPEIAMSIYSLDMLTRFE